jgi:hypothetical protein
LASADAALVAASLTIMVPLLRPSLHILKPCVRPGIDPHNGTDRLQVSAGRLLDGPHHRADKPSCMIFESLDLGLPLVIELTDERVQLVERASCTSAPAALVA